MTETNRELVKAAQAFSAKMFALLDQLDTNHTRIMATLEERQAARRERAIHAAGSEAFKAHADYYRIVAEMVRACGFKAVIEHWREAARTDGTTPKRLRDFECLVRAVAAGLTLSEYLEFDSPRAWFARQATAGSDGESDE